MNLTMLTQENIPHIIPKVNKCTYSKFSDTSSDSGGNETYNVETVK